MSLDNTSRIFFIVAFSVLTVGVIGAMLNMGGCFRCFKTSRSNPTVTTTPTQESTDGFTDGSTLPPYTVVEMDDAHTKKPSVGAFEPK